VTRWDILTSDSWGYPRTFFCSSFVSWTNGKRERNVEVGGTKWLYLLVIRGGVFTDRKVPLSLKGKRENSNLRHVRIVTVGVTCGGPKAEAVTCSYSSTPGALKAERGGSSQKQPHDSYPELETSRVCREGDDGKKLQLYFPRGI